MATEKPEEKKARLQAERDKLNRRLRRISAKETNEKRKADNHLKAIVGGMALKAEKEGQLLSSSLLLEMARKKVIDEQAAKAARKKAAEPELCQCGAELVRGSWKKNGESVEGWKCPKAFVGVSLIPGHDLKAD